MVVFTNCILLRQNAGKLRRDGRIADVKYVHQRTLRDEHNRFAYDRKKQLRLAPIKLLMKMRIDIHSINYRGAMNKAHVKPTVIRVADTVIAGAIFECKKKVSQNVLTLHG